MQGLAAGRLRAETVPKEGLKGQDSPIGLSLSGSSLEMTSLAADVPQICRYRLRGRLSQRPLRVSGGCCEALAPLPAHALHLEPISGMQLPLAFQQVVGVTAAHQQLCA